VNYGHSTNFEFDPHNLKYKYVSNFSFGGDLGVVYEYRPEPKEFKYDMDGEENQTMSWENKYKLRLGLSLVDLGYIKYQKGLYSHDFDANVSDWYTHNIQLTDSAHPNNVIGALDDTLRKRFTMGAGDKYFKMNLPTVLNFNTDYNFAKNLYLNFDAFLAFKMSNNANKVHEISTFSLTPRWDHRWFGVFVPFSYNSYKNFNIGADFRIGPLIIGANNLFQFFSHKDIYAADFHVMLKLLIPFTHPHDRDNDHVSDKKDQCPDTPGVWEFKGCPDRDKDHVQDKDDLCPDDPGLPEFQGCPDRDGDKIPDKDDKCPDDPGLKEFGGCPDKDGDGIMDKEDDCPDVPGIQMFHGCPDTDHDSIMDKDDKCPTKPGPIENHGCPYDKLYLIDANGNVISETTIDKDGNFIFPTLPPDEKALFKLESFNEPPEITQVKVGVTSTLVRIAKKGPDQYFRFDILKPDEKKLKDLNEPDVKVIILTKQEEEVVKKAFNNLEFETGKDIIKPESYASLNELAGLLKKKGNWRLLVSGHTDNVGGAAKNMELSKKRSMAVKKYLEAQGLTDDRFIVKWYGQTKPIADNKTPQGRQKNRRVEMLIIE
jgi:outer membrane protein OmpA-like peptidoglycan-associated protein